MLRLVDWLPVLYLVGFITVLATGRRQQRLGDLAAGTAVLRTAPSRHRRRIAWGLATALVLLILFAAQRVSAEYQDPGSYRDHGVSFDFPTTWQRGVTQEAEASAGNEDVQWSTAVGPAGSAGGVDAVLIFTYRLNLPVTPEVMDAAEAEFTSLLGQLADQVDGSVTAGPQRFSTPQELPGLRYQMAGTIDGVRYESSLILIFDGTTEYFINCQYTASLAAEIQRGCEQVVSSLRVD